MTYKDYAYEQYPYLDTLNESYTLLPEKTIVANYEFNNEEGLQEEDRYQLKSHFFSLESFEKFKHLEDELSKIALTLNRLEVRRGDIKIKFFNEDKEEITNKIVSAEEIKGAWSDYDKDEGLTLEQEILLLRFEQVKNKKQILYREQISVTIEDLLYKGYMVINADGETYSPPLKTLREAKYFQIVATYDMEDGCAAAAFTIPRLDPAAKAKDIRFLKMIDAAPIKKQSVRLFLLGNDDKIVYHKKDSGLKVKFIDDDGNSKIEFINRNKVLKRENYTKCEFISSAPQYSVQLTTFAENTQITTIKNQHLQEFTIPKGTAYFILEGDAHGFTSGSDVYLTISSSSETKKTIQLGNSPDNCLFPVYHMEFLNPDLEYRYEIYHNSQSNDDIISNIHLTAQYQLAEPYTVTQATRRLELDELVNYIEFSNAQEIFNEDEDQKIYLEGYVTSGSINVNGSSAIRRTGSLQMVPTEETQWILQRDNLININTRFALEIGFDNMTHFYANNSTIWLPQGVFIVTGCSVKENANSLTLSINFKDKSAYLNGELGGILPASFELNYKDMVLSNGDVEKQPILVKEMTEGLMRTYSIFNDDTIIIDIDTKALKALAWRGSQDAYLVEVQKADGSYQAQMFLDAAEAESIRQQWKETLGLDPILKIITFGDSIGWQYTDFTYSDKSMVANAGDNIVGVLNKITNAFVNYEFFVDTYGIFRFQKKKNSVLDNSEIKYSYCFNNNNGIITAYNNNPQYLNVKNDFILWGEQEVTDGYKSAIMYHLVFDNPRRITRRVPIEFGTQNSETNPKTIWKVPKVGIKLPKGTIDYFTIEGKWESLGENKTIAIFKNVVSSKIKGIGDSSDIEDLNANKILRYKIDDIDGLSTFLQDAKTIFLGSLDIVSPFSSDIIVKFYDSNDALLSEAKQKVTNCKWIRPQHELEQIFCVGPDDNYYYQELEVNLYRMIDLSGSDAKRKEEWDRLESALFTSPYWLDFIYDDSFEDQLITVGDIGRRTKIFSNVGVNCIVEEENVVPYIFNVGDNIEDDVDVKSIFINIPEEWAEALGQGGIQSGAREYIRSVLHNYISYNETVSITTNPIYHLEPNTIVKVERENASITGNYNIESFNIPLDTKSQMTIQLKRNLEMLTSNK